MGTNLLVASAVYGERPNARNNGVDIIPPPPLIALIKPIIPPISKKIINIKTCTKKLYQNLIQESIYAAFFNTCEVSAHAKVARAISLRVCNARTGT